MLTPTSLQYGMFNLKKEWEGFSKNPFSQLCLRTDPSPVEQSFLLDLRKSPLSGYSQHVHNHNLGVSERCPIWGVIQQSPDLRCMMQAQDRHAISLYGQWWYRNRCAEGPLASCNRCGSCWPAGCAGPFWRAAALKLIDQMIWQCTSGANHIANCAIGTL